MLQYDLKWLEPGPAHRIDMNQLCYGAEAMKINVPGVENFKADYDDRRHSASLKALKTQAMMVRYLRLSVEKMDSRCRRYSLLSPHTAA